MSGQLWVNPEGVSRLGSSYDEEAVVFLTHLRQLGALRDTYGGSWGGDDLGQQFSLKFLSGLGTLEKIVNAVAGLLGYAGEGLRTSGRQFRLANEDAGEASHYLHSVLDNDDPRPLQKGLLLEGQRLEPTRAVARPKRLMSRLADTPMERGMRVRGELLKPKQLMSRLADTPLKPLRRMEAIEDQPARVRALYKSTGPEDGVGRGVLTSSMSIPLALAQPGPNPVTVGGTPIPEGFRVISFNEVEDGIVRLDFNHFEALAQVPPGVPVRTATGELMTPEPDAQFFIVRHRDPDRMPDPTAEDYRPQYMTFRRDGGVEPYRG